MNKENWGGKGLFSLYFYITVHHQRQSRQEVLQDRNLQAGADTEATEACSLLAAFHGLLSLVSYRMPDHQARDGTTDNGLVIDGGISYY